MTDPIENRPTIFADSIAILAALLHPDRRQPFMDWLSAHRNKVVQDPGLNVIEWFTALSESQALQEYELIIGEIGWWRDLKEETLAKILNEMETG